MKIRKTIFTLFFFLSFFMVFSNQVFATEFDEWSFSISNEDDSRNQIIIEDGEGHLSEDTGKGKVWNLVLSRYKTAIVGFSGIGTLVLIGIGMFLFTKLAKDSTNPRERKDTLNWIGILFVAAALLGSVTMIFAYSYGFFR